MSIELNPISSGYSTGLINENFQKLEDEINNNVLRRDGLDLSESNQMELPLDMNGFPILNIATDSSQSGSLITVGEADARYVNIDGDTMAGPLSMGSNPLTVRVPVAGTEPVQKDQLETETAARESAEAQIRLDFVAADDLIEQGYQDGDANLQAQISGLADVPAVERPIIQWHGQTINNSITIPDNMNAFTTGPSIAVEQGQSVTVGSGSYWTIVDGVESGSVVTSPLGNFDEGTL